MSRTDGAKVSVLLRSRRITAPLTLRLGNVRGPLTPVTTTQRISNASRSSCYGPRPATNIYRASPLLLEFVLCVLYVSVRPRL